MIKKETYRMSNEDLDKYLSKLESDVKKAYKLSRWYLIAQWVTIGAIWLGELTIIIKLGGIV